MKHLLIVFACLATLPAEELLVRDLRLGVALTPTSFSYETSDPLATAGGDDAFDQAYGASLRVSWSWSGAGRAWAPILACELLSERASYGTDGRFSENGLRGLGGLGWQLGDDWVLSALGLVGAGRPSFTVPVASGGSLELSGASASTGVLVGLEWRFARSWSLSAEAGWIEEVATLSGDGTELDLTRSGLTAGLGLVWAWSRQPVRLE